MPNARVPAAATGLPKITRRAALAGVASISAIGAAGTALAAAPAEFPPQELEAADGPLLALGQQLGDAIGALGDASYAQGLAILHYRKLAPAIPADLVAPKHCALRIAPTDDERDALGNVIIQDNGAVRRIYRSWLLEEAWARWPDTDLYPGSEIARLLPIARDHEDAVEAARQESGLDEAMAALLDAECAISRLVDQIAKHRAATAHGLFVQAAAYRKWSQLHWNTKEPAIAEALIDSVLGIARGVVS